VHSYAYISCKVKRKEDCWERHIFSTSGFDLKEGGNQENSDAIMT